MHRPHVVVLAAVISVILASPAYPMSIKRAAKKAGIVAKGIIMLPVYVVGGIAATVALTVFGVAWEMDHTVAPKGKKGSQ